MTVPDDASTITGLVLLFGLQYLSFFRFRAAKDVVALRREACQRLGDLFPTRTVAAVVLASWSSQFALLLAPSRIQQLDAHVFRHATMGTSSPVNGSFIVRGASTPPDATRGT